MDYKQIELVQKSLARLHPVAKNINDLFYVRLHELDPKLSPIFKGFMVAQDAHFLNVLALMASGLARPEAATAIADHLGRRHLGYGVKDQHYQAFCKALVRTLAHSLGDDFTPEVRAAWVAAFDLLVCLTKEAAAKVEMAYCH
ncbi:MAG: globin domain-containing protein [Chloroflexota bacterium]|nr:globin domain-containing protein [Chloroflexota bacterium]